MEETRGPNGGAWKGGFFLNFFCKKENVLLDAITKENPPIATGLPFRIHV